MDLDKTIYDDFKQVLENWKEKYYEKKQEVEQLEQELDKYKNIVDELERYIKDELILDFYNDDMPCELIVNKMENMIKELKGE